MTRIMLEGCDGSGKTTLAKILAEAYELDICHCTQYDPSDYNFYNETLKKENCVWDRHTVGELIYPYIFRREPKISFPDVKRIIENAKENNIKMFILTADIKTLRTRISRRIPEEHEKIVSNIEFINSMFLIVAKLLDIPVIDTTKLTLYEIIKLGE